MRIGAALGLLVFVVWCAGWHYGQKNGLQQGADGNFQCKIEVMG